MPILIFLEQFTKRGYVDNLTKVIIEALKIHGNVSNANITTKLISFRANGVNVFQGLHNAISHQIKKKLLLVWKTSIAWHIAWFNHANFVLTPYGEMHKGPTSVPFLFVFSQPEMAPWIFEACRYDEPKRQKHFVKCQNMGLMCSKNPNI